MYEISTAEHKPVNLMAGNFPVVTECGPVKEGATVRKYAPVALTADGITEAAARPGAVTAQRAAIWIRFAESLRTIRRRAAWSTIRPGNFSPTR